MPIAPLHLGEFTSVSAGFAPKDTSLNGDCAVLQLADFTTDGSLQSDAPRVRVPLNGVPLHHLLQAGDVLLAAKGARLLAACVEPHWLPAAAATTLLVLRPDPAVCQPEFLALWLNQPATRLALQSRMSATSVATLNKRDLLDLPMPGHLPSLEGQRRLVELNHLRLEEKRLALRLTMMREAEFNLLFAAQLSL